MPRFCQVGRGHRTFSAAWRGAGPHVPVGWVVGATRWCRRRWRSHRISAEDDARSESIKRSAGAHLLKFCNGYKGRRVSQRKPRAAVVPEARVHGHESAARCRAG